MLEPGTLTTADIPRLIEELRGTIQSETRRPLSPAVLRLSNTIEVASGTQPRIEIREWAQWDLSPKQAELASLLLENIDKGVHRETILAVMYPDTDNKPCDKLIDVMICKIRKKLAGSYAIENDWGQGYRMIWTSKWGNPRDVVEWRGIFMGRKAARIAECLLNSPSRWFHQRELASVCGSRTNAIGRIMVGLRKNLLGTPYAIQSVRSAGHRMVRIAR